MPKRGSRRRKRRTHVAESTTPGGSADAPVPKALVIRRGRTAESVTQLVLELRKLMLPNTAEKLREKRQNNLKDFVQVAAPLGLTHFLLLSQTDSGTNMRIARVPQGPTMTFKVNQFSLMRHVRALQRRPFDTEAAYHTSPLVVMNNFGDATAPAHVKLMRITFQNLFPAINVQTVQLNSCRRLVLFHYNKEDESVEMRHYGIRASPTGISRSVKNIVQTKIPKLGNLRDISEYIMDGGGAASDSEMEDEASHVVLPQNFAGRGNSRAQKSAIRLAELGPRLNLKLLKVEKGFCEGEVMYHSIVQKSAADVKEQRATFEEANALKKRRREEQESNVERKKQNVLDKKASKSGT